MSILTLGFYKWAPGGGKKTGTTTNCTLLVGFNPRGLGCSTS